VRKTLLKFDNVLNDQRHVIFTQRNNIITQKILCQLVMIFWMKLF